jgi:hypothetical protein
MRGRVAAAAAGVTAALRSPLWLRRNKLVRLIGEPDPIDPIRATHAERADQALRAAQATLRLLGRAAFPMWRNTCLYRAVAECLVLRRYGIPCRLELGVGNAAPGRITAHAWVVRCDGAAAATASPDLAVNLAVLR